MEVLFMLVAGLMGLDGRFVSVPRWLFCFHRASCARASDRPTWRGLERLKTGLVLACRDSCCRWREQLRSSFWRWICPEWRRRKGHLLRRGVETAENVRL